MYIPTPTEGKDFQPCPAGTHLGICTRVIDLGTQESAYNGEKKRAHKIMLTWEIPDERMEDGRPFSVSQFYTWSMHEKSTLRKHLEAWRGVAFGEKDFGPTGFDIKNVLGKPCTLNIVEVEKNGKVFSNIAAVGKLMKGMQVPQPTNELLYLWIHPDRWDVTTLTKLSHNIQQKIMASPEYKRLVGDNSHDSYSDDGFEPRGSDHREPPPGTILDDEIPF